MIFAIDFDGTLSMQDTVDGLLEQFADPRWESIEADWLEGRIDAQTCMKSQLQLVCADQLTLEKYFRQIALDPSFHEFWRHVRQFAHVAVVSDGLDHAVQTALRHNGLGALPVFSNRLRFVGENRIDLEFPLRSASCAGGNGVCKCAVARGLQATHGGPIVLVGDGKSDACLAAEADVVFAKGSLVRHCEAKGIPFSPFETFADVLQIVQTWPIPAQQLAIA